MIFSLQLHEVDPTIAPIFFHEVPETQRRYETYTMSQRKRGQAKI